MTRVFWHQFAFYAETHGGSGSVGRNLTAARYKLGESVEGARCCCRRCLPACLPATSTWSSQSLGVRWRRAEPTERNTRRPMSHIPAGVSANAPAARLFCSRRGKLGFDLKDGERLPS